MIGLLILVVGFVVGWQPVLSSTVKSAKISGIDGIFSYFMKFVLPFIENSLVFLLNT